ncbi:MAG: hypothetical protein ABSA10_02215 [Anaerolineales bacterium]|jgi:hypothetical protein
MLPSDVDMDRYPGLKRWVIGSFSGHKKVNDIIYQLCQQTGWDWNQAKQFVDQVARESQKEIHQRRMPLLLGIGLLMMVSGTIAFVSAFPDLQTTLSQMEPPLDLSRVVEYIFLGRSGYLLAVKLVTGTAMLIGGGIGTLRAVTAAMTGEGEDIMKNPSHRPQ